MGPISKRVGFWETHCFLRLGVVLDGGRADAVRGLRTDLLLGMIDIGGILRFVM